MTTSIAIVLYPKPRKDGKWPVRVRIIHQKQTAYQTLCYVDWKQWNNRDRLVVHHPNYRTLNEMLHTRRQQLEEVAHVFKQTGQAFTGRQLLDLDYAGWKRHPPLRALEQPGKNPSFLDHAQWLIDLKQKNQGIGTAKRYRTYLKTLKTYLTSVGRTGLMLSDVTDEFLTEFFEWCRNKPHLPNKENTLHRRFGFMRTVLLDAQREGLIVQLPYRRFKAKAIKVAKVKLQPREIQQLETLAFNPATEPRMTLALKTYLLQFYLYGSRISDVLTLQNGSILGAVDRAEFQQRKTHAMMSVKLNPKAQAIVAEFYNATRAEGFLLPWLKWENDPSETREENEVRLGLEIESKTAMMNKYLQTAGKLLGFDKRISTHTARHSFAQHAKRAKVDIHVLKQALGHASIRQTEGYLADLDSEEIDQALAGVFG